MSNSTIWVLVANERGASISASHGGESVLLQAVNNEPGPGMSAPRSRCAFACMLVLELSRGVLAHAYEGLILVANREMMDEIRALLNPNVARLLIGALVRELPDNPADWGWNAGPGLSPATGLSL